MTDIVEKLGFFNQIRVRPPAAAPFHRSPPVWGSYEHPENFSILVHSVSQCSTARLLGHSPIEIVSCFHKHGLVPVWLILALNDGRMALLSCV